MIQLLYGAIQFSLIIYRLVYHIFYTPNLKSMRSMVVFVEDMKGWKKRYDVVLFLLVEGATMPRIKVKQISCEEK